jgi:hypothetical protein
MQMNNPISRSELRLPKPLTDLTLHRIAKAAEVNHELFGILTARSAGGQIHKESDLTWVLSTELGGISQIVSPRFKPETCEQRLHEILTGYAEAEQFLNITLGPSTQPDNIEDYLRDYGLHCYSRSPPMISDLSRLAKDYTPPKDVVINIQDSFEIFERYEHPDIGRMSTPLRRARLQQLEWMTGQNPRREVYWGGQS